MWTVQMETEQGFNWALILWCQREANYFKCGQCSDGYKFLQVPIKLTKALVNGKYTEKGKSTLKDFMFFDPKEKICDTVKDDGTVVVW